MRVVHGITVYAVLAALQSSMLVSWFRDNIPCFSLGWRIGTDTGCRPVQMSVYREQLTHTRARNVKRASKIANHRSVSMLTDTGVAVCFVWLICAHLSILTLDI